MLPQHLTDLLGDRLIKKNIDKAGGDGTAEFVRQAISVYC